MTFNSQETSFENAVVKAAEKLGSRYYILQDTQFEYREGEEEYHLFDRWTLNQWGRRTCVLPFASYEECVRLKEELEEKAQPKSERSPSMSELESYPVH